MKLNLGQNSEARFGQDFRFQFSRDADVWLRLIEILKLKFVICVQELACDTNSTLVRPLYLLQCLL